MAAWFWRNRDAIASEVNWCLIWYDLPECLYARKLHKTFYFIGSILAIMTSITSEKIYLLAESFKNVKNRLSIITSKSLSKNLSNESKHWYFCFLQDKTWIKMPILWNYWDSLTNFLTIRFGCCKSLQLKCEGPEY